MTPRVANALNRLTRVLPLKEKQESCGPDIKRLHQDILRSFVEKGRIMTRAEMAEQVPSLEGAVSILEENDMVVFSDHKEPLGAYPFTMEEREHKVFINGRAVYAMCALDALAVSPMFGLETLVNSQCRVTCRPVQVKMSGTRILNREENQDLYFGIAWAAADACSCCADSLCMEMMFLKDSEIARQWQKEDAANREIFTLEEAVDFGAGFFVPLMS